MKLRWMVAAILALLLWAVGAPGQMTTTRLRPALTTAPMEPTTAPAEEVDPAVMEILRRLEQAGQKYPCITADLRYHEVMRRLGDTEDRTGWINYQAARADSPMKFRIHFETIRQGQGRPVRNREDYVFDGEWFTMRKEPTKQYIMQQMAAPGQRIEALDLGKGPFPVPFGQRAENVLKHFQVATRPRQKDDPEGCDHLKLAPRPEQKRRLDVEWMEVWVRPDGLPVKIVGEDASGNTKTVVFENIATPDSLPKDRFELPRPLPGTGWTYEVHRYQAPEG